MPRSSPGNIPSTLSSPAAHPRAPAASHHSLAPSPAPAASSPSHSHGMVASQNSLPPALQPLPPSYPYAHQSPYPPPPPPQPQLQQQQQQQQQPRYEENKLSPPETVRSSQPVQQPQQSPAQSQPQQPSPQGPVAMDVDQPDAAAPQSTTAKTTKKDKDKEKEKDNTTTTAPTSQAPSPKPARTAKDKDAPTKLPQGSGLISNALFGVDDSATEESDSHSTPNIILHIPLNGTNNRIVNFARLAEEQYGFAALHPRLAAHKERLARVAAVGAALERNEKGPKGILSAGESADEDLSLDMDRDSDLDGDVAMAGAGTATTNGATPADGADGKKKRRKKIEEYDRDDPFVDDSEMAWQEHAAASKDGYFVYSGPLVPEGEKVQVERADGTVKRGRGRGRGGRSRAPATTHQVPLAAAVPISQETGLPLRGPGSRGGSTTRRPRVSKAARQQMENEKQGNNHATNGSPSQGRGGGMAGRGGSRGGKISTPTPSATPNSNTELAPRPNLAPAPPGPSPLSGTELAMK